MGNHTGSESFVAAVAEPGTNFMLTEYIDELLNDG